MKPGTLYLVRNDESVIARILDGVIYEGEHPVGQVDAAGNFELRMGGGVLEELRTGRIEDDKLIRGDGFVFHLEEVSE